MKRCTYCGHANEDSAGHCVHCGEQFPGPSSTPVEVRTPEPAAPVSDSAVTGAPVDQQADQDAAEFAHHFHAATPRIWVTYTLMGLNCLIFLLMGLESSNLVHPNIAALLDWGANWGPLTTLRGGWWRLFAAVFLHFTVFHLLCNMFALWQAGVLAERLFGNWFFLAVYLGAGLASSLTSLDWHPAIISAGASGAIFGIYGALLGYLVRQRGAVPRRIWVSLGKTILAFVAFNLFYGLTQLQVDNAAHVGGLLAGLVLGWVAARPLHLSHRQASTRRAALQFVLTLLGMVVPLVKLAPQSRPEFGRLLSNMGETVARGAEGPKDPVAALWWYRQAAGLGSAEGEFNLGRSYFEKDSGVPRNPAEGIQWLRQAADHGSTNAEISLGFIYYYGQDVPADHAEARRWLTQAAERGLPEQQFLLGQMYHQGDGTARDYGAAFKWIQLAAEQGMALAQAQLAAMYFQGEGTATNLVEAARWARVAANHGQPNAQLILGSLYANGQGLAKDEVEAYAWISLAAQSPEPVAAPARQALEELDRTMTPSQLERARHRMTELTQKITGLNHPAPGAP